tara:strand:+ start:142 stop:315 length:174 start_codon:yes stop_codon:yes gene_type:complete
MNKRIQIKHDKQKIQKLEQRIDDLIGMNNELEELIKRYEYEDKNFNAKFHHYDFDQF